MAKERIKDGMAQREICIVEVYSTKLRKWQEWRRCTAAKGANAEQQRLSRLGHEVRVQRAWEFIEEEKE